MEIVFETFWLRDVCRSQEIAEQALYADAAKELRTVVADMRAAPTLGDFRLLHSAPITDEIMTVTLTDGEDLTFRQSHFHPPKRGDCVDLDKVYRVRVLSIGGRDG